METSLDAPVAPLSRRRRRLVLGICSLSLFMNYIDGTIVNVALPTIEHDLRAGIAGLQWIVDGFLVGLTCLLILAGSVADRFGRRRVFLVGLVIFATSSLLCSIAGSVGALVAFRLLQAVGGSMLVPTTLSIVRHTFTDAAERARAIGVWSGIFGLALASGPIVGGVLVDFVGWRSVFWVNVPISAFAFVMARRYVPESRAAEVRRFDPLGQALVIVTLLAFTYAVIEGPGSGWSSPRIVALFAVSAASAAAFVFVERRGTEPLLELGFFSNRLFAAANAIATLSFVALGALLFLSALYLQEVRGDSALHAALELLPVTVATAATAPFAGRFVAHHGPRLPLRVSGPCCAAGMLLLATVEPSTPYATIAFAFVLLGFSFGAVNPTITNAALNGMPVAQAGVASAVTSTSRQLGSVLGVAVLGAVTGSVFNADVRSSALIARLAPGLRPGSLGGGIGTSNALAGVPADQQGAVDAALRHAFASATHPSFLIVAAGALLWSALAWRATRTAPEPPTGPIAAQ